MIKRFDTEIAAINHFGRDIIKIYHEDKVYYNAWFILSSSAKGEINTKFGSTDGPKVINAAQQHIKSLGKEKGSNLLQFINEDPMMVCSLGLEPQGVTMPIRWLVGDGASLIDLGIKLGTGSKTLAAFKYITNPVNNKSLLAGVNVQQIHYNQYLYYQYQGTWNSTGMSLAKDTEYEIETSLMQGSQYIKVNGVIKKTTTSGGTQEPTTNTCIFSYSPEGTGTEVTCKFAKAWLNGELVRDMVPFIGRTMGDGMIDLADMNFHENKGTGTFGEAYTRNGQPWTPSTP